ncbi:MAG: hypothetical protein QM793_13930 [Muricomes sp.]
MAVNSINSSGMGYYKYQASINNFRLNQALSNNPKLSRSAVSPVPSVPSLNSSLKSSMNFVKEYSSSMSDLMSAANELRKTNSSGAMNDLVLTSTNESVASADQKLALKSTKDIQLDVTQVAQAQRNVSDSVSASETAQADMNFTVSSAANSVNIQINVLNDNGTSKTNAQMLQEAADQINKTLTNVKAAVVQEKGVVSLALESKYTGRSGSFNVSGELGAAKGADITNADAKNAKYSVTVNGKTTEHESSSNAIYLDSTRIGATIKSAGSTTIKADVDADKVAFAISDLVTAYNSTLKLLNDNYGRGTGVDRQLRNLVTGLGSEQSLGKLGITVEKDASLKFNKAFLANSLEESLALIKDLISGTGGLADKAFNKAVTGMSVNSGSLINNDWENAQSDYMNNPQNIFNIYSKSGTYAMNNYYAVGMMMNLLV